MKFLLTLLFSFYASLDVLILFEHPHFVFSTKQRLIISILSSFCTAIGISAGALIQPLILHYTPDELVTIAMMFILLYLLNVKTKKYALILPILSEPQWASFPASIGILLGINNLGFGFLAGLQMLSVLWSVMFSFLFSCLLLFETKKWNQLLPSKAFSIFLLIIMIILIQIF